MGRLVKILLVMIISYFIIPINCDRWDGAASWNFEWTIIDSINPISQLNYIMDIRTNDASMDCNLEGSLDSTGVLFNTFSTNDESLFLPLNPTLRMKLVTTDSIVVYDSLFNWDQLEFKKQYSIKHATVINNLSKKTICIRHNIKIGIARIY